jgi:hypothetical protein
MNAVWTSILVDKMDGRVVTPDHGVVLVAKVPGESKYIVIERRRSLHIRYVKYRCTLKKLYRI